MDVIIRRKDTNFIVWELDAAAPYQPVSRFTESTRNIREAFDKSEFVFDLASLIFSLLLGLIKFLGRGVLF